MERHAYPLIVFFAVLLAWTTAVQGNHSRLDKGGYYAQKK